MQYTKTQSKCKKNSCILVSNDIWEESHKPETKKKKKTDFKENTLEIRDHLMQCHCP